MPTTKPPDPPKYIVLKEDSVEKLAVSVNLKAAEGYKPAGGLMVCWLKGPDKWTCHQAMWKD